MIRVAFTLIGGVNWTGGQNYLLNLLEALVRYKSHRITPVLFLGEDCKNEDLPFYGIQGIELVHTRCLNKGRRKKSILQALLWGEDIDLRRLFKQYRIDLIFESAQFFGWRLKIPAIAWIPDFQHKILPDLFPLTFWLKREIGFRMQVAGGRAIMLSSEDARKACEHYYPSTLGRSFTVSFAKPSVQPISFSQARSIADLYGLPEHFFFMPNQFYRHKNHGLVLKALTILKKRHRHIVVAASGKQADPRHPNYFPNFINELEKQGLQEEFRLLGLIPYAHLLSLMRACTAMLNPSLFEGWSTTVEEARSMGTPMLLSDLNVHHEQMGGKAVYFQRYSAQSLACALEKFIIISPKQREIMAEQARKKASESVEKFAENFVNLVEACLL